MPDTPPDIGRDLQRAAAPLEGYDEHDLLAKAEYYRIEAEGKQLENESLRQRIKIRKYLSLIVFGFLVVWSALLFFMLFQQGYGYFHLSDKVLIALLTVTMVNIVGLFYVVVNYYFPSPKMAKRK